MKIFALLSLTIGTLIISITAFFSLQGTSPRPRAKPTGAPFPKAAFDPLTAEVRPPSGQAEAEDLDLHHPAPASRHERMHLGIANLGNTCFLNAFLKYMAYNSDYQSLLHKNLHRRPGESQELFHARQSLQKKLRQIRLYISNHGTTPGLLPSELVEDFMASWNKIAQLDNLADRAPITGIRCELSPNEQEDTSLVLRGINETLEIPKLPIRMEYIALDADLAPIEATDYVAPEVSLSLGREAREQSMQSLIERFYGEAGPEEFFATNPLAIWRDRGYSSAKHPALRLRWFSDGIGSLTLVIEDRIYSDWRRSTRRKNTSFLKITPQVMVPVKDLQGSTSFLPMTVRSVVTHWGASADSGHYVLNSYDEHSGWLTHNDTQVNASSPAELEQMARGARIVHYERTP